MGAHLTAQLRTCGNLGLQAVIASPPAGSARGTHACNGGCKASYPYLSLVMSSLAVPTHGMLHLPVLACLVATNCVGGVLVGSAPACVFHQLPSAHPAVHVGM